MNSRTPVIAAGLGDAVKAAGFDLWAATTAEAYNARVPGDYALDDLGRPRALVIVIGNSRALWPVFGAALRDDASLRDARDPLDAYAARVIGAAAARMLAGVRHAIYYAPEPPPRRIAMQQLADVAGLAALAPSHLCVHPTFGPWIGLRAAIVVDVDGPDAVPCARACDCATGCGPALERALGAGEPRDAGELRERWKLWLAVRDACPVGRAHRYGDEQIRYHYTGDRETLP